jgi:hypothetical protein
MSTTTQSGWNARGMNPYRLYRMAIENEVEAKDRCEYQADRLHAILGEDEYQTWIDNNLPDGDISWVETAKLFETGIAKLLNEPCVCSANQVPCIVCARKQKDKEFGDLVLREILENSYKNISVRTITAKGVYQI